MHRNAFHVLVLFQAIKSCLLSHSLNEIVLFSSDFQHNFIILNHQKQPEFSCATSGSVKWHTLENYLAVSNKVKIATLQPRNFTPSCVPKRNECICP